MKNGLTLLIPGHHKCGSPKNLLSPSIQNYWIHMYFSIQTLYKKDKKIYFLKKDAKFWKIKHLEF